MCVDAEKQRDGVSHERFEWLRSVGNIQLIVFSVLVIVFARFFRTGLWGIATGRRR